MRREKRRLAALAEAIRPARSLAARLDKLTPEQRLEYDAWRALRDRWYAQFKEPGDAYASYLEGNSGPILRRDIGDALYGPAPTIPASATLEEAAEIYRRYLEAGQ